MAIIYPLNISAYVDENNLQIVTNFESVLFNNQVKELKNDGHFCTFRNFMLTSLLQNNEYIKGLAVEVNMITVTLLRAADVLSISLDSERMGIKGQVTA